MCLFNDKLNSWCGVLTSPVLKAGFEWKQNIDDAYWQMSFQPFFTPAFKFTSNLEIARLIKQVIVLELVSFTMDMYYSFLFSYDGQVCVGNGWDLGEIMWKVEGGWSLKECSKVLLNNMCDFDCWVGKSA